MTDTFKEFYELHAIESALKHDATILLNDKQEALKHKNDALAYSQAAKNIKG